MKPPAVLRFNPSDLEELLHLADGGDWADAGPLADQLRFIALDEFHRRGRHPNGPPRERPQVPQLSAWEIVHVFRAWEKLSNLARGKRPLAFLMLDVMNELRAEVQRRLLATDGHLCFALKCDPPQPGARL